MASPNELRAVLMLEAKVAEDDEAVDRIADMGDAAIEALAADDGATTFASSHEDGEEWETGGRYYRRAGGATHRIAGPGEEGEGGGSGAEPATPAPAQVEPETEEEPEAEASADDKGDPAAFEKVLADTADEPPESRAATIASWVVAPVFPQTRQRVEEGLAEFLNGNHDVMGIIGEQANKLAGDSAAPSVERAFAGIASDLIGGGKPFGDVLRERLEPVRQSLQGDKLKINAIEATSLGIAAALNSVAPGAGTVLGGAIDELAHQLIEKKEQDWNVIAQEVAKAATIGIVTRRLGKLGKTAGVKAAGKIGNAVAGGGRAGDVAGYLVNKGIEVARKTGAKAVGKQLKKAAQSNPEAA